MVEYLTQLGKYPPGNITEKEIKEIGKLKKELEKFQEMDLLEAKKEKEEEESDSDSW